MQRFISSLILLMVVCGSASAASLMGLGDLPGGAFDSRAYGVSDDGNVVVGTGGSASGPEAFRWEAGVMTSLGELPGGYFRSGATGVSADGSIVIGITSTSLFPYNEAFRWQDGVMTGLGDLPGGSPYSYANGVSADGNVVVGTSVSASGTEGFRWQDGVMTGLGDLPGGYVDGSAFDVSADGNVIIGKGTSTSGQEAFRWVGGVMTGLGDLPGGVFDSVASSVSADGTVVVGASHGASGTEAFRLQGGIITGLGKLAGSVTSSASDVSADGSIVVGSSTFSSGGFFDEAIIWTAAGGMQKLLDVLAAQGATGLSGWILRTASAVSPDGFTIVGYGINPAGQTEAYRARLNSPPLTVTIDIQPWDATNAVQPSSDNPISVAVLSTNVVDGEAANFDATQVNPASLNFGIGEASNIATPWVTDLDGDSDSDVLFSFSTQDTGIVCDDTEATLTGETYSAAPFTGTDFVTTTDCVDTGCHP
jgi:probable HAF family extracellular repeat protein